MKKTFSRGNIKRFYINYEECKSSISPKYNKSLNSFILTMRNVNHQKASLMYRTNGFYINYEECKLFM